MAPQIVEVKWTDAIDATGPNWVSKDELRNKGVRTRSVGYLMKESKKALTLVSTINKNDHCANGITIPKGMVDSVRPL